MAQRLAVRTIARRIASEAGRQGAPGAQGAGRACSALRAQQAGSASTLCTAQRPAGDVLAPHLDVVPVGGADVGQRHDAGVADEHVKPGKRLGRRTHSRRRLPHRRKRLQVAVDLLHARARARHAGERSQRRVRARRGAVEHEHGRGLQAHGGHAGEVAGARGRPRHGDHLAAEVAEAPNHPVEDLVRGCGCTGGRRGHPGASAGQVCR